MNFSQHVIKSKKKELNYAVVVEYEFYAQNIANITNHCEQIHKSKRKKSPNMLFKSFNLI